MREGGKGEEPGRRGGTTRGGWRCADRIERALARRSGSSSAPRAIVAITLFYMSVNVAGGIVTVVIPLYVRDVLHGGAETFGLLLSALTAGTSPAFCRRRGELALAAGPLDRVGPVHERPRDAALAPPAGGARARGDPLRLGRRSRLADAVGPDDPDAPDPARDARPRLRPASDQHAVDPPDRRRRRRPPPRSGRSRSRSSRSPCCLRSRVHRDLASGTRPRPDRGPGPDPVPAPA